MAPGGPPPTAVHDIFAQLSDKIPQFQTRKALIVLNMQNDIFAKFGDFYLCEPQDFRDRLLAMVPSFRSLGEIIWVNTELEYVEPTAGQERASPKTQSKKDGPKGKNKTRKVEPKKALPETAPSGQQVFEDSAGHYFASSRAQATLRRATPEAQAKLRTPEMIALSSEFEMSEPSSPQPEPHKGPVTGICQAGTSGADFTAEVQACMDPARDLIVIKHHHSAFDTTPLLMSLRMKLVTHVYLAGALTNISVLATASDAVRNGFEVTVVEDCLGYRSEKKHFAAMQRLADDLGVEGVDSEEIIDEAGGPIPPDADEGLITGPGIDGIRAASPGSIASGPEAPPSNSKSDALSAKAVSGVVQSNGSGSTKPNYKKAEGSEHTPKTAGNLAERVESTETASQGPRWRRREPTPGPEDRIGEGDSKIVFDALSKSMEADAFQLVRDEVDWQAMLHRTGEVPRRVAVQGEIGSTGSVPIYRHPADESPPLLKWTPTVRKIRDELQALLKQPFNHALIQLYRSGQDFISEHSDKTLDVVRGSSIINMSLGAQRTMTLRTKKAVHMPPPANPTDDADKDTAPVVRQTQRIPMPHNSVFVLGQRTNARWLHGVRADKRLPAERLDAEKAFGGERISLTFRHIGTFTDPMRSRIWGQGAVAKTQEVAGKVSTSDSAEMEAMVIAFGKENQQADFGWDAEYGGGFDTLNLVVKKAPVAASEPTLGYPSASVEQTLFLGSDRLSNLRVALAVLERRIHCRIVHSALPPPPTDDASGPRSSPVAKHPGETRPLLRGAGPDAVDEAGDMAILRHIAQAEPPATRPEKGSKAKDEGQEIVANLLARITQANELFYLWQKQRGGAPSPATQAVSETRQGGYKDGSKSPLPSAKRRATAVSPAPEASPKTAEEPAEALGAELATWEKYVEQTAFAGGADFSVVDAAFWPLLDDVVTQWTAWSAAMYPHLHRYWKRVGSMEYTERAVAEIAKAVVDDEVRKEKGGEAHV